MQDNLFKPNQLTRQIQAFQIQHLVYQIASLNINNFTTIIKGIYQSATMLSSVAKFIDRQNYQLINIISIVLEQWISNDRIQDAQVSNLSKFYMHFSLALLHQITGNQNAEKQYETALSYKNDQQIILKFVFFYYNKKKYKEALNYLTKLQKLEGNIRNIYTILEGNVYRYIFSQLRNTHQSQIDKKKFINKILQFAQHVYYRCLQIEQIAQNTFFLLGQILIFTNRFEDAYTLALKLRNINNPKTQKIQFRLAQLFFMLQKWQECADSAYCVIKFNPRDQKTFQILIQALSELKKYEQAKIKAFQLIKINKYNPTAYKFLGITLLIQENNQLGIQCLKLCVSLQPSQKMILANAYLKIKQLADAQMFYVKSIKQHPTYDSYFFLGALYLKNEVFWNATICFMQATKHNSFNLRPFINMGLIAQKNYNVMITINDFMWQLEKNNPNSQLISTNLAVYLFISKQSKQKLYDFLRKFLQQQNKKQQITIYLDLAKNLIREFKYERLQNIKCLDSIFIIIMAFFMRVNQQHAKKHQIYTYLINKYKKKENDFQAAFIEIYEKQISDMPIEFHPVIIQFIIAEMIQENTDQAVRCFFKYSNKGLGNYEQFYSQLYKKICQEINYMCLIDLIANSILGKSQFSQKNQSINNAFLNQKFKDAQQYLQSLEKMICKIKILNSATIKDILLLQKQSYLNYSCLSWKIIDPLYHRIQAQINKQQENININIQKLQKIYRSKTQNQFILKIAVLFQSYFNDFVINQKIKFIFNHFYSYIISEDCHKQFAETLLKLKKYLGYSEQQLKQDLQNIFLGNRHKKSTQLTQKQFDLDNSHIFPSEIQPLIDMNSQTKSLFEQSNNQPFLLNGDFNQISQPSIYQEVQKQIKINQKMNKKPMMQSLTSQELFKKINIIQNIDQFSQDFGSFQDKSNSESISKYYSNNNQAHNQQSQKAQQKKWYLQKYNPNNTKFIGGQLYSKFNEFVHLNTFYLIKYLSKQQNIKHIAQHICNSTKVQPKDMFSVNVQFGRIVTLEQICSINLNNAFRWVIDIAKGIAELQSLGIYHADLKFNNTIQIQKGGKLKFKIIDFDKAFKVIKTDNHNQSFQYTKHMLDFWLRFDGIKPPKYKFDSQSGSSNKISNNKSDQKDDIIKYIFIGKEQAVIQQLLYIKQQPAFSTKRLEQCIKLLQKYMHSSHLQQYCKLVRDLLLKASIQKPKINKEIESQIICQILEWLQKLKEKKVCFNKFAKQVIIITGLKDNKEDDQKNDQ